MGTGRGAGRVRWAGVGGIGRGNARLWRVVSIFERNLRTAKIRACRFFSFYLATVIQRSSFDCLGSGWALAIRIFFLAGTAAGLGLAYINPHAPAARSAASYRGCHAGNYSLDRSLRTHSPLALSPDHGHLQALERAVARCNGDDRMDYLRRHYSLQCAAGI